MTETELSRVDGDAGELTYRGYRIEDLAREASYEEVVYLLWHGVLPDEVQFESFRDELVAERDVADEVLSTVRTLAEADENPMAAFRTAVSMLSAFDDSGNSSGDGRNLEAARRITAQDADHRGGVRANPRR